MKALMCWALALPLIASGLVLAIVGNTVIDVLAAFLCLLAGFVLMVAPDWKGSQHAIRD